MPLFESLNKRLNKQRRKTVFYPATNHWAEVRGAVWRVPTSIYTLLTSVFISMTLDGVTSFFCFFFFTFSPFSVC